MTCDVCDRQLDEDYTPQVDARGRPCLAICEPCNDDLVRERAQRLDLFDRFEDVLNREIKPRVH